GDWTMQPAPVQWQGGNILSGWSQGIIPTRDQQGLIQLAPSSITIDGSDEYNEMLVGRQQLIVPGVSYTVRNENSRLRLEVPAGSSVLGTRFQQAELTKYTRQRWAFSSLDDNVWMVTNEGNGLVWDHNWEPVAGDPVFQWDYNALLPQQWRLVPTGRGPWKVLSGAGENLALSVAGGSIASGALIELAAEAAVPQQEWLPVEVGSADAAPPSAPVGLSAVDGDGKVRLEWSANSETDLAGYSVARASSSGGPYQVIASGVSGSAFTDITVDNGSIYYYVVTAVDAALNESGRSVEVTGVPDAIPELTAFYDLDGNMLDGSGNNHHAGSYGFPVYESGAIGRSVVLDGSDDFAVLPFGLADFDDMTFACWVNWTGSGGDWQRIFDFGNDTTQNLFLTPRSGAGTLRFGIRNGGDEQMTETSGLPSGTWVHVAVTLQGNVATIYVNGTPAASNSGTTINPSDFHPALNYLGKSHWPDPLFNGRLDEVYLCNYALSESEIVNLMNNHYPPSLEPAPLSIASGNGMIRVSWPDEFSGWRLQRKDALSMTNWIDVPDAETVSVMQFPEGTNAHMFFRMVYP
ncbi:MAG: RICIN domain-containing protein, partial [Pontiellaceae bacterium]|nr:RICIN domain-containing protein [Pontiellaceae bacterium]